MDPAHAHDFSVPQLENPASKNDRPRLLLLL